MNSEIVHQLVPIIAILMTFGLPVGIIFVTKYFTFKHRELEAELEARKMLSDRDRAELDKRIERLESIVMGARVQQGIPPLMPAHSSSALYEPPPSLPSEPAVGGVKPREKI